MSGGEVTPLVPVWRRRGWGAWLSGSDMQWDQAQECWVLVQSLQLRVLPCGYAQLMGCLWASDLPSEKGKQTTTQPPIESVIH